MQRVSVVGTTGSGKTTVAAVLGRVLQIPVLELDGVYWGPGWTPRNRDMVHREVQGFVAAPAWVVDGNYRSVCQDLVWARADTVVWLDLPFRTIAVRLLGRTARRVIRRERLWAGNRETLGAAMWRDSILFWAVRTFRRNRERYRDSLESGRESGPRWLRLRSPAERPGWGRWRGRTRRWPLRAPP